MLNNVKFLFEPSNLSHGDDAEEKSKDELQSDSKNGIPVKLWNTILDEVYQRSVGPDIEDTKKYKSFSSETYGELNPP